MKKVSSERGTELLDIVFDVVIAQVRDHAVIPDETTGALVRAYTATPALLTLAVKLLKDNNITTQDADVDGKLNAVEAALADRKKRSHLASVSYLHGEAVND